MKPRRTGSTAARGNVKEWSDYAGWGVLISPDIEGQVFAHEYGAIWVEPLAGV